MSNDTGRNVYERLFKLWAMVGKLILDKKRDPSLVADMLQSIISGDHPIPYVPFTDVTTQSLPAVTEAFMARAKFVFDQREVAGIKISRISAAFTDHFLSGEGLIESPHEALILRFILLRGERKDEEIVEDFGGQEKAKIPLSAIFALMRWQGDGEKGKGPLRTDGMAHSFYCIADAKGSPIVVRLWWTPAGWSLDCDEFGNFRGGGIAVALE